MKPLPRPLREVLAPPSHVDARVAAIWGDLQRRRRVKRVDTRAAFFVFATVAALLALVVNFWPREPLPTVAAAAPAPAPAAFELPATTAHLPVGRSLAPLLQARLPTVRRAAAKTLVAEQATPPPTDVVALLLDGADAAWKTGQRDQMKALLNEVAVHHAEDPHAPMALYVLGRLQLEDGKAREAAENFRHAIELDPPDDLVTPLWELLNEAEARAEAAEHTDH